ncbi:MAG: single-stranded DNA-binding protein [Sulfitobacter sp.]
MQILIIAGNCGKDAVLRRTQSGDAVLGFSLAIDNGKDKDGNKRETTWVECSVWGKRAESLERYITKGTKLTLTGRPTVRAHEGKAYLGLSVNDLTFMGGGSDSLSHSQQSDSGAGEPSRDMDSQIPF